MPGITIDKFDIGIYIQYAKRTQLMEQVLAQYHMKEASGVPAQALIVDLYPKLAELDLLLGVTSYSTSWAYFYAPKSYAEQRRAPFAFHKVAPRLGEREHKEGEPDDDRTEDEMLDDVECRTPEENRERRVLKSCFKQIEELNSLLRYIGGRIGQFLQG